MAHAQVLTTYDWTFTGTQAFTAQGLFNGQGRLTVSGAVPGGPGAVVAMTGTLAGAPIISLYQPFTATGGWNGNTIPLTSSPVVFVTAPVPGSPYQGSHTWSLQLDQIQTGTASNGFPIYADGPPVLGTWEQTHRNTGTFVYTPVPEPSTYGALAALGLAGFGVWRRVRR